MAEMESAAGAMGRELKGHEGGHEGEHEHADATHEGGHEAMAGMMGAASGMTGEMPAELKGMTGKMPAEFAGMTGAMPAEFAGMTGAMPAEFAGMTDHAKSQQSSGMAGVMAAIGPQSPLRKMCTALEILPPSALACLNLIQSLDTVDKQCPVGGVKILSQCMQSFNALVIVLSCYRRWEVSWTK
jgi:hypothetical protein